MRQRISWLPVRSTGYGRGALAAYIIGMAIVTIVSVLIASETRGREMG